MRMRVSALTALLLLSGLGFGCSSEAALDAPGAGLAGSSSGGTPGDGGLPLSVRFETPAQTLVARTKTTLEVRVEPPGFYQVRFDLPSSGGDPLDAVLDRPDDSSDAQGLARVELTAPSSTTSFEVRATVGSKSSTLKIEIEDGAVATLRVEPSYPSALRNITTWIASVHLGETCADVPGIPYTDGAIKAPPAAKTEAPLFTSIPAGKRLAVALRSGHYVGGCTSIEMLAPGTPDRAEVVKVVVLNRPIDLSASSVAFSLDLPAPEQAWNALLTETAQRVLDAISSEDDVDALLDAMRASSGAALQAFTTARDAEGWDAALRSRWGQGASSELRNTVSGWLTAGRQSFASAPHAFTGLLTPIEQPAGGDAKSTAKLRLRTVADLDAQAAGFVADGVVSWSASSDDNVVLGTDLYFVRSELAATLAETSLLDDDTSEGDAPERLAERLDCEGIGAALAALGSDPFEAYPDCDGACLASACQSAVRTLWLRGRDVDGADYSRLSLTATGRAYVGDAAELTGLTGTWIGELTDEPGAPATGGALTAAVPTETK
jgi:hypothetical protein